MDYKWGKGKIQSCILYLGWEEKIDLSVTILQMETILLIDGEKSKAIKQKNVPNTRKKVLNFYLDALQ